jgi:hypothetical protein
MSRALLAWTTLSLLLTATGCRMCFTPYDECSPTFTGECGEDCAPRARAGSILSGYFPFIPSETVVDEPTGSSVEENIAPPAGEQAAFDAEVSEATTVGETPPENELAVDEVEEVKENELPSLNGPAGVAKDTRVSSQGWTAVRQTSAELPYHATRPAGPR